MMKWIRRGVLSCLLAMIAIVAWRSVGIRPYGVISDPQQQRLLIQLDQKRASVSFQGAPMDKVVAGLSKAYGVKCEFMWQSLGEESIDRRETLSFVVENATLAEVFDLRTPSMMIRGDAFVFCSPYYASQNRYTRIYDLRPLLVSGPNSSIGPPSIATNTPLRRGIMASLVIENMGMYLSNSGYMGDLKWSEKAGRLVVEGNSFQHLRVMHRLNGLHEAINNRGSALPGSQSQPLQF